MFLYNEGDIIKEDWLKGRMALGELIKSLEVTVEARK